MSLQCTARATVPRTIPRTTNDLTRRTDDHRAKKPDQSGQGNNRQFLSVVTSTILIQELDRIPVRSASRTTRRPFFASTAAAQQARFLIRSISTMPPTSIGSPCSETGAVPVGTSGTPQCGPGGEFGAVVLVDARRIVDALATTSYFENRSEAPFVVAVNISTVCAAMNSPRLVKRPRWARTCHCGPVMPATWPRL